MGQQFYERQKYVVTHEDGTTTEGEWVTLSGPTLAGLKQAVEAMPTLPEADALKLASEWARKFREAAWPAAFTVEKADK